MIHQQMERGASDANMNGQRPRTPSAGDNAPSPSKRPRLDPQFPGQPMMQPNGRPSLQAMQMQQLIYMTTGPNNTRLLNNGINPSYLTPEQLETFHAQAPQVQDKSIQVYAQNMLAQQKRQSMPQPGMPGQGSPMMQGGIDVGAGMQDFYNGNGGIRMGPGGQPNGPGNHALQDYQMQLMLLEQQNKKRLLMARQEQENLRPDGQTPMAGGPGYPAGMSPQGSRSGPSPNPSDQMKRGTPNIGQVGLPGSGSPMPDGSMAPNRGSPGPMNFAGQLGPDMFHPVAGPNGTIMRGPSSTPQFNAQMNAVHMEAAMRAQQNGGRIPNGVNWQQGQPSQAPMMPQVSQAQQPMGTPQQRTMPPPSALPASGPANGRPASPSQPTAAPPTPQQASKAAPKGRKDGKETNKKVSQRVQTNTCHHANFDSDLLRRGLLLLQRRHQRLIILRRRRLLQLQSRPSTPKLSAIRKPAVLRPRVQTHRLLHPFQLLHRLRNPNRNPCRSLAMLLIWMYVHVIIVAVRKLTSS